MDILQVVGVYAPGFSDNAATGKNWIFSIPTRLTAALRAREQAFAVFGYGSEPAHASTQAFGQAHNFIAKPRGAIKAQRSGDDRPKAGQGEHPSTGRRGLPRSGLVGVFSSNSCSFSSSSGMPVPVRAETFTTGASSRLVPFNVSCASSSTNSSQSGSDHQVQLVVSTIKPG
jgi:hypothetical protein